MTPETVLMWGLLTVVGAVAGFLIASALLLLFGLEP